MHDVPNSAGSDGYGEAYGEDRDSSASATGKISFQDVIRKANTVPLIRIFKHYGVRVNPTQSTIVCPFKFHKGGRENTGSFTYYPNTNSFHCYGCKTGGPFAHGVEFIASMDGLSKAKAAFKILRLFASDVDEDGDVVVGENSSERLEIMMDFSNTVREFRQAHFDEKSFTFIEAVCAIYDDLQLAHKLDNEALRRIVGELKEKISSYKPCLTL
jgi:DNA primase